MSTPAPPLPVDADPALGVILDQFVTCVCAELTAGGRPTCACCLVWGNTNPPADFCDCSCEAGSGQAWVRVMRWDPAPTVSQNIRRQCQAWRYRVWLEAGVYRCVSAVSDSQGNPPTCEQRAADAWGLLTDARLLRTAAACCAAFKNKTVEFISEEPTGVLGACSGVFIQFTVEL